MVALYEATKKVLSMHPNEYVHVVNEYKDVYQFMLMTVGEDVTGTTFIARTPAVNKRTGEVIDNACIVDDMFQGDYKQHIFHHKGQETP